MTTNTATNWFTADDREAVAAELARCEQVQSWTTGSTRSKWIPELQAIIETFDAGGDVTAAVEAAEREAVELATKVAKRLSVDVDELREALQHSTDDDEVIARLDSADDIAELVAIARTEGLHTPIWERDGFQIGGKAAVAFAQCRSWVVGDVNVVTVDLVTGEVL